MSNNHQRAIYNILTAKSVAYNASLARILGSVKAGILLAQLLYWQGKGRNKDWTYKTVNEMKEETALSRTEQETAIAACKRLGVLEVKRKGIPPRRHFRVDMEKLILLLGQSQETRQSISRAATNHTQENLPYNSYSTPKNTQESTNSRRELLKKQAEQLKNQFQF